MRTFQYGNINKPFVNVNIAPMAGPLLINFMIDLLLVQTYISGLHFDAHHAWEIDYVLP